VDIKRVVGRNIRLARKAQGLSQLVLADMNLSLGDLFAGELQADSSQEALIELIGLCRGRAREDIELVVGIAQLIFQGRRDHSRRP
jgi:hypothetical protein